MPAMETLTHRLKSLSSAEDFLAFFGVPYEERVVQVNRLHILKRFYQYLHTATGLDGLGDVDLFRRYRELLAKSYADFVTSTPAQEKVFKVFQDAGGRQSVAVGSLRESLADRQEQKRRFAAPPPEMRNPAAASMHHLF
jgi:nitrogenase-stabilizing/protective protein